MLFKRFTSLAAFIECPPMVKKSSEIFTLFIPKISEKIACTSLKIDESCCSLINLGCSLFSVSASTSTSVKLNNFAESTFPFAVKGIFLILINFEGII